MTTGKIENISSWEYLCYPALIALFFMLYTYPVFEGDFFWHLNSGEWIWNNRSLPRLDPFTFTADPAAAEAGSHRIRMILTQYWLGQLAFYGLWNIGAFKAIILARAVCYSVILLIIGLWSRKVSRGIVPFFFLFTVGAQLLRYPNERPQLFAFLLMPLMLYLLENMRTDSKTAHWQLPSLMLLWANIHGSFILGAGIIVIYAIGYAYRSWTKTAPVRKGYLLCLLGSVAITLVNPNGFWTLVEFFRVSSHNISSTFEYQPPFISLTQAHSFDPYWLLLLPTLLLILLRYRKIPVEHTLLLSSLALLSLSGGRYIPFFMFAVPIVLINLPAAALPQRYEWGGAILVLCLFFQFNFKSILKFRESSSFPRQAVSFIDTNTPPGRIFNHTDWGGYLSRYAPRHQVFLDGRVLIEDVQKLQQEALNGIGWRELFDRYNISVVILPPYSRNRNKSTYGGPVPLVDILLKNDDWRALYRDQKAIVFAKKPTAGNT